MHKILKDFNISNSRIIFPEGASDERVLAACIYLKKHKILEPIIIDNKNKLKNNKLINKYKIETIKIKELVFYKELIDLFVSLREKKGVDRIMAEELIKDNIYLSVLLLKYGYVDGMVCGAINTTAKTLKPTFEIIKSKDEIASSCFYLYNKKESLIMGDCAVNPVPNADNLALITKQTCETAMNVFKINPYVALLSYSTLGSGSGTQVEIVQNAVEILKQCKQNFDFFGEIQTDAALDKTTFKLKTKRVLKRKFNTFIFPDLQSGNIGYKLVRHYGKFKAIGPIMQGLNKPVNDVSRSATIDEIIDVAIVTAIQSITG